MTSTRPSQSAIPGALVSPLRDLSSDYRKIADGLDSIVAAASHPGPEEREQESRRLRPQHTAAGPGAVRLELSGAGTDLLLGVIDQLASCPGIEDISVTSIEDGYASVLVEVSPGSSAHEGLEGVVVVCARCDRLVSSGEVKVSHGLCDDCARQLRAEFSESRSFNETVRHPRAGPG